MATKHESGHQGGVKDPENDGRLKENREEGRTKGTTPGSAARAHEHGREPAESSHSRSGGSHSGSGSHSGERSHGAEHSRGGEHSRSHEASGGQHEGGSSRESRSESDDLKSREYRDEKGEIHHHTRTYMEQHGKEQGGGQHKS